MVRVRDPVIFALGASEALNPYKASKPKPYRSLERPIAGRTMTHEAFLGT